MKTLNTWMPTLLKQNFQILLNKRWILLPIRSFEPTMEEIKKNKTKSILDAVTSNNFYSMQGLVKGAILCFRNPYFYFRHGESTSTASQLTSPASQKSKDLNKVSLLLQDLDPLTPLMLIFSWIKNSHDFNINYWLHGYIPS